jgi:DNA-binding transcriptional LysR family regulator
MDIYQLRTLVAVAREKSITRASERLHLSQPAVSAHIKALEDTLGLTLFDRTPRGMSLTPEGARLLAKAEQTLAAQQELLDEATRIKGHLTGKLRLGAGGNANNPAPGLLVGRLAEQHPGVEVTLVHGTSLEVLAGLRNGTLDAGFYHEAAEPEPALATLEVASFGIHLVAPRGTGVKRDPLDWSALAAVPWIYPTASACCGRAAEGLFEAHQVRPRQIISVDREDVTRTLIARGAGVGLLHDDTSREAQARGEVELLAETPTRVRVLFAYLASRAQDPVLLATASIVRAVPGAEPQRRGT